MTPDNDGYTLHLMAGWQLTVSAIGDENTAWLTNNSLDSGFYETTVLANIFLDLEHAGFVPTVYHEEIETPPLVLFHAAQTGRVYEAGRPGQRITTGQRTGDGRDDRIYLTRREPRLLRKQARARGPAGISQQRAQGPCMLSDSQR